MNKQELIEAIAQESGRTAEAVAYDLSLAYDVIFTAIIDAVAKGQSVEISGFGVFSAKEKEIKYVNRFGECFRTSFIKRVLVPDFSPDFNFRDAVSNAGRRKP